MSHRDSLRFDGRRGGFSYIEAVVSTSILAVGIVSALHLYGSYAKGSLYAKETAAAHELAAGLMAEIAAQPFEDAEYAPGTFGGEAGEAVRADFDDVDDYDKWTEDPPEARDGTKLTGYDGYVRGVEVYNVEPSDLSTPAADGSTDAKRIVVTVMRSQRPRGRLELIRMHYDAQK